jgi:hypothetical protein
VLQPDSRLSRGSKKIAYRGRIRLCLRLVASRKGPTQRSTAVSMVMSLISVSGASTGFSPHSRSLPVRDRFAEQIWREPKIPAVLRGSNGLSGSCVDISSIGSRRIDFLGRDNEVVVSLPMGTPRGLCLDIRKSSSHPLTNETITCHSRLCPVVRAQWLLWYARPSPTTWLLGSAELGIVYFAAFLWYVTRNNHPHHK